MNMWIISMQEVEGMSFGSDVGAHTHTHTGTRFITDFIRLCILSESVPMCAGKHHSCHWGRTLVGFIIDSVAAALH